MARKILSVKNLQTSFFTHIGEVKAVRGISFTLSQGEIVGLVGESGCGKSVTSLSIMGLLPYPGRVIAGEIEFLGKDLLALRKDEMRKMRGKYLAMIFQDPMTSLDPVYTIGDQVSEMIRQHEKLSRNEVPIRKDGCGSILMNSAAVCDSG